MTTGRINQVATRWPADDGESSSAAADRPFVGNRQPNAEPMPLARRRCCSRFPHTGGGNHRGNHRITPPSVVVAVAAPGVRTRLRDDDTAVSERLPNAPCELGILKTVKFVTNANQSVPSHLRTEQTTDFGACRTRTGPCVSRPGTSGSVTARIEARNDFSRHHCPTPDPTYIVKINYRA